MNRGYRWIQGQGFKGHWNFPIQRIFIEMAESSYQAPSTTDARTNRDSIKKGFYEFKRFASTNFTRAVQVSLYGH